MLTRRDFLTAAAFASAAFSGTGIVRGAARQSLTQDMVLAPEAFGDLTILHVSDIHAQTQPIYYREPLVNLGVGEAKGEPPHLTDAEFLRYFGIPAGLRDAYALTSADFNSLAR